MNNHILEAIKEALLMGAEEFSKIMFLGDIYNIEVSEETISIEVSPKLLGLLFPEEEKTDVPATWSDSYFYRTVDLGVCNVKAKLRKEEL